MSHSNYIGHADRGACVDTLALHLIDNPFLPSAV
jgi:hypothetical protein